MLQIQNLHASVDGTPILKGIDAFKEALEACEVASHEETAAFFKAVASDALNRQRRRINNAKSLVEFEAIDHLRRIADKYMVRPKVAVPLDDALQARGVAQNHVAGAVMALESLGFTVSVQRRRTQGPLWHAESTALELVANNPLELLGLADT